MEQARVVIVGAGPAGLVAGLSLEQQGIAVGWFPVLEALNVRSH